MTEKFFQAKRNHHHVWADYLRRWTYNDRDICYTKTKGGLACDSVRGIAMKRDFYQTTHLNSEQVRLIRRLSKMSPDHLHLQHMKHLNDFLKLQNLEDLYRKSAIEHEEAEKMFHALKCNWMENLHLSHETHARPILKAMAFGDISVLKNKQSMARFSAFIGQQFCRTKNFKDICCLPNLDQYDDLHKKLVDTMEHAWWFVSYIFGINIGASMFFCRHDETHSLLINSTDTPFITSDQPIINVHECLKDDEIKPPEFCDFYFPISPTVAYINCQSAQFPSGKIEVDYQTVNELNIKIAKQANDHIFGKNEDDLHPYKRFVGKHFKTVLSAHSLN